jgi:xanthine dehydrogenase accessory factor
MTDHRPIFAALQSWADARLAIATVVSTWGSAPRPRGSHMLVHEDGRFEGSVSGGCVEGDVLDTAARVIATGVAECKRYGVAIGVAWEVGLPCGGEIEVLVQPVGASGFPRGLAAVLLAARDVTVETDLNTGLSRVIDAPSAAEGHVFTNRYAPAYRLLIVGAVQIAQALAVYAQTLGITVTVIDPRARFLTSERFPGIALDDRWPDDAITALRPDDHTAVVTLSHDIKIDDPALLAALAAPTAYIAALGSTKSHTARRARLGEMGVSATQIDRIEGPAGLAIGALGAAEIGLSIAAGMVRTFRAAEDTTTLARIEPISRSRAAAR